MKVKAHLFILYIVIVLLGSASCFASAGHTGSEAFAAWKLHSMERKQDSALPPLLYINTAFENASPVNWEIKPDGEILLNLVYDHERASTNKSVSHWHFQVQAKAGADLTFIIQNYVNIYNGRTANVGSSRTHAYISRDGRKWTPIKTALLNGNHLKIVVHMEGDTLYLAGVEPYRLSDLEKLLARIKTNPRVKISQIGTTVEGRPLEMIRVGDPHAPYRIFIRGRAHAYEAGGNWVLQGLINQLLADTEESRRYLKKYCLYILPMANKDGVARGKSRFNSLGVDLNRNWNAPADPVYAPENYAVEAWLKTMIRNKLKPHLLIDLHNDASGGIHLSRPPHVDLAKYLANMKEFENLLRKYTWFTEGSTGVNFRDGAGSIGEGVLERYGIDGCIFELNIEWIAGLNKAPLGEDWELMGRQLAEVFFQYFKVR